MKSRLESSLARRRSRLSKKCGRCRGTGRTPKRLVKMLGPRCPRCMGKGRLYPMCPCVVEKVVLPTKTYEPKFLGHEVGQWVAVRPCAKDCKGKTFLGVMLGDLPLFPGATLYKNGALQFHLGLNPAIYVPDLKRIVWGAGSFWGVIKSPEGLKQITDADIENVWYVRALKELGKKGKK